MLSDHFTRIFRQERRQVRDTLLDLVQAFQKRDRDRIASLLTQAAVYTGPHFSYDEESLYPLLEEIFGREYIEKQLCDHDRVIGTAKKLIELAGKDRLTNDDVATVRGTRDRLQKTGLNLIQWANEVRRRPAIVRE
jgi:hemerythrin HHE cation binding domain-containing protein